MKHISEKPFNFHYCIENYYLLILNPSSSSMQYIIQRISSSLRKIKALKSTNMVFKIGFEMTSKLFSIDFIKINDQSRYLTK